MALIFHHYLHDFRAGSVRLCAALADYYARLNATRGALYWAVGFSGIGSASEDTRRELELFALNLDPGLSQIALLQVGRDDLDEAQFLAIAWDPAVLHVERLGQVMYESADERLCAYDCALSDLPPDATLMLPPNAGCSERRGLGYLAATAFDEHFVIGFMHNSSAPAHLRHHYDLLGQMVETALAAMPSAYAAADIVLGGNFELDPRPPRRMRANALALQPCVARDQHRAVQTCSQHTHDFWLTNVMGDGDHLCAVHPFCAPVADLPLGNSPHAGISYTL